MSINRKNIATNAYTRTGSLCHCTKYVSFSANTYIPTLHRVVFKKIFSVIFFKVVWPVKMWGVFAERFPPRRGGDIESPLLHFIFFVFFLLGLKCNVWLCSESFVQQIFFSFSLTKNIKFN